MILRAFLLAATVLVIASPSIAHSQPDIVSREAEFYKAFLDADANAMREIFADNFLYQHGSGTNFDKDSFSQLIESGVVVVTRADAPQLSFQDFGSTVVSSGVSRVEGKVDGDFFGGNLRFVNVWHREAGDWLLHHRNSEFVQ